MNAPPLSYVTTAVLEPGSAQAVQILSMSRAFGRLLSKDFVLVSCACGQAVDSAQFKWHGIHCRFRTRTPRYVELGLKAALMYRGFRGRNVYTRDIGVAALLQALGARVTYEMHHDFRTGIGSALFTRLRGHLRFVAISTALQRYMTEQLGVDKSRVLVAHDGVFVERYDAIRGIPRAELRERLDIPVDRFVLMHTGSLYSGRGIELFEPVLCEVPEALCICVGGSDADATRWRQHYRQYPNMRFITYLPQDKLVQYQLAADALLFPMTKASPIWWCTSPLKLFEYLAAGVPMIGSAVGSAAEVIGDHNAVTFDPEDASTLVQAVRWVMRHPDAARERARLGLDAVRRDFTWDVRARRILEFLSETG